MANWVDYFALGMTLSAIVGAVYLFARARNAVSGAVASTKDSLKNKGLDVSHSGVSVKTDKRLDREHYLDATQRGFIKAFNASSAGNQAHVAASGPDEKESRHGKGGHHRMARRSQAVEK